VSLAQKVGLTEGAVRRRIDNLLKSGEFRIVAVGDPELLGLRTHAVIGMRADMNRLEELTAELAHPALQLPWPYRSPVSLCCDEIAEHSTELDRAREAMERWPLTDVAIQHRTGRLEIGETSLLVAVSAPHRAEALAACQQLVDRFKEVVPIWKKEVWEGGEVWIEGEPVERG
jgi:DNA-binding Lrp family transcriptional regulator